MNKEQKIIILGTMGPLFIIFIILILSSLHHPEKGFLWEWYFNS